MPIQGYGLLTARVLGRQREASSDTPHFQIHLQDDDGTDFRAAVNVLSQQSPPELLYLADEDFRHPVTDAVQALGPGWHALPSQPGGAALDFIRANLFDPAAMRPLPPNAAGPDNDLADMLDHYVQRAIGDGTASLSVFGQRWGPEPGTPDTVFGFRPGNGVHDVHMNQGNSGSFRSDDGVWVGQAVAAGDATIVAPTTTIIPLLPSVQTSPVPPGSPLGAGGPSEMAWPVPSSVCHPWSRTSRSSSRSMRRPMTPAARPGWLTTRSRPVVGCTTTFALCSASSKV